MEKKWEKMRKRQFTANSNRPHQRWWLACWKPLFNVNVISVPSLLVYNLPRLCGFVLYADIEIDLAKLSKVYKSLARQHLPQKLSSAACRFAMHYHNGIGWRPCEDPGNDAMMFIRVFVYHRRWRYMCISPQQRIVFIWNMVSTIVYLNYIWCVAWHGATNSSTNAYYVDTSIDACLMGEGLFLRATGAALEEQRPLPSLQCLCWCSGSENGWKSDEWGYVGWGYAKSLPITSHHFPLSFQGPRQQGDWWGRKWAKCVLLLFWFWGQDCVAFASSTVYRLKINQSRASSDSRNKNRPFFVTLASPKSSG